MFVGRLSTCVPDGAKKDINFAIEVDVFFIVKV